MKGLLYIIFLLLSMPCVAQTQSQQESHGACNPNLLKNLGTISITCNVVVATTPIGGTTVSAQSSSEASFLRANRSDSEVYVDENLMFGISWPKNSSWFRSDKMEQTLRKQYGLGGTAFGLVNFVNGYLVSYLSMLPLRFFLLLKKHFSRTFSIKSVTGRSSFRRVSIEPTPAPSLLLVTESRPGLFAYYLVMHSRTLLLWEMHIPKQKNMQRRETKRI